MHTSEGQNDENISFKVAHIFPNAPKTGFRLQLHLHGLRYSCRCQTVMQIERTCFLSPLSLSDNRDVFWMSGSCRLHRQNNIRRCDPPSRINLPLLQPAEPRSRAVLCLSWQQLISGGGCPQSSCIFHPPCTLQKKKKWRRMKTVDRWCSKCKSEAWNRC